MPIYDALPIIVAFIVLSIELFVYQMRRKSDTPNEEALMLISLIAAIAGLLTIAVQELLAR